MMWEEEIPGEPMKLLVRYSLLDQEYQKSKSLHIAIRVRPQAYADGTYMILHV